MEGKLMEKWDMLNFIGPQLSDKLCFILLYMCLCVIALSVDMDGWKKGVVYAEGQNLARLLMEAPANHITPTAFANTIEEKLAPHAERVTIQKRFVLS